MVTYPPTHTHTLKKGRRQNSTANKKFAIQNIKNNVTGEPAKVIGEKMTTWGTD